MATEIINETIDATAPNDTATLTEKIPSGLPEEKQKVRIYIPTDLEMSTVLIDQYTFIPNMPILN